MNFQLSRQCFASWRALACLVQLCCRRFFGTDLNEFGKKNVSEEESWQSWTISWTYEMHLKRHIIEKKTKNGDEL